MFAKMKRTDSQCHSQIAILYCGLCPKQPISAAILMVSVGRWHLKDGHKKLRGHPRNHKATPSPGANGQYLNKEQEIHKNDDISSKLYQLRSSKVCMGKNLYPRGKL